jgi:hypothetical protein
VHLVETAGTPLVARPAAQLAPVAVLLVLAALVAEQSMVVAAVLEQFEGLDSPVAAAAAAPVSDTADVFGAVAEVAAGAVVVSPQHSVEREVPLPTAAEFSCLPSALPVCAEAKPRVKS